LASLLKKLGRAVTFHRNIQTLALTGTVAALASSSLIPISQPFMLSIIPEEDITALGAILTIASLASSLVAVLGGFVADKYGRKPMMVLGTVLSCMGAIVYFQTRTTIGLLAAVLLSSVGGAMTLSLSVTMVSESAGKDKRASSFGYVQMLASMGSAIGPIIGSWASISYGTRSPFLFAFGMYLLAFAVILAVLRETHRGGEQVRVFPWRLSEIKQVHHSLPDAKSLYMLVLAQLIISFGGAFGGSLSIVYASEVIQAGDMERAIMTSVYMVTSLVFMIPAGRLSDKIGRVPPLLAHEILYISIQFGYALAQTPIHLILLNALTGFTVALGIPGFRALQTELMPQEHRAKLLSLYGFIAGLAATPGPLLSSLVWNIYGPRMMFVLSGILVAPTALVVYTSVKETLKPRQNQ
jgi:DHA1 family multidrug resistance protein-like MFS transporter